MYKIRSRTLCCSNCMLPKSVWKNSVLWWSVLFCSTVSSINRTGAFGEWKMPMLPYRYSWITLRRKSWIGSHVLPKNSVGNFSNAKWLLQRCVICTMRKDLWSYKIPWKILGTHRSSRKMMSVHIEPQKSFIFSCLSCQRSNDRVIALYFWKHTVSGIIWSP